MSSLSAVVNAVPKVRLRSAYKNDRIHTHFGPIVTDADGIFEIEQEKADFLVQNYNLAFRPVDPPVASKIAKLVGQQPGLLLPEDVADFEGIEKHLDASDDLEDDDVCDPVADSFNVATKTAMSSTLKAPKVKKKKKKKSV